MENTVSEILQETQEEKKKRKNREYQRRYREKIKNNEEAKNNLLIVKNECQKRYYTKHKNEINKKTRDMRKLDPENKRQYHREYYRNKIKKDKEIQKGCELLEKYKDIFQQKGLCI